MKVQQFISSALLLVSLIATSNAEVLEVPSQGMRSIGRAITKAQPGDTILVGRGTYEEKFFVPAGVVIKAKDKHKAIIDGSGRGTVVTLSRDSEINGLVIQNGTIGVFSKNEGAKIKNCQIVQNWMTGIITVRAFPTIEDNLIAFNRGSGVVCWDSKSRQGEASHNTIAYNGKMGFYLGGESTVVFKNNVVAFNRSFAMKMQDESVNSTITNNNFWENLPYYPGYPEQGITPFDPGFRNPKTQLDFSTGANQCCSVKSPSGESIGIRYEQ